MESGSNSEKHEGEDMISDLPDSIIGHILSFLSTKQAVLTSVLSKRWIYIWTFVTKLSFNDYDYTCPSSSNLVYFSKFVDRVLFHLNTATIHEFHLSISQNYDPINQWISCVLNRGVKNIQICMWRVCNISCDPFFKCQTLETFVFMNHSDPLITIKLPSFVCLTSLTILKLIGIEFTCYSSNEFKELTLNFPLLREYVTRGCTRSDLNSITIEAPLLESVDFMSYYNPSIQSQIIKFRASHITHFSYECHVSSQTILIDDQHIPSAKVLIYHFNDYAAEKSWIFIQRLLSLFINAECLDLCYKSHRKSIAPVEHYLDGIPTFQMLAHLHLSVTSDVLLGILLKSPRLETLVFKMEDYDKESQNFTIVPDCFITTLKMVKFEKSFAGEGELSFAKFVMENAKVLERISFVFPELRSFSKVKRAKEKLSLIKFNSSRAIMDFSIEI